MSASKCSTNNLLDILEDKIKLDLTSSLKEKSFSKEEKANYMYLFKFKLNNILNQTLIMRTKQYNDCNKCDLCFINNYIKCYCYDDYYDSN
jgi:hypothetical protein